jgi:hypothetical protein
MVKERFPTNRLNGLIDLLRFGIVLRIMNMRSGEDE